MSDQKAVRTTFSHEPELRDRLVERARVEQLGLSDVIRRAIAWYLEIPVVKQPSKQRPQSEQ